jgi:uncharacterized repeat protein (TIGR02543 family)
VYFDSQGGSSVIPIIVTPGNTLTQMGKALPAPTRNGYTFEGWYTAASAPFYASTPVNASITVYARWTGPVTIAVTGVTLSDSTLSIPKDSSKILTATVLPENAGNKAVTWSTSDSTVATVTGTVMQSGMVMGIKNGTATITVTTADGNKTATCNVTVSDKGTGEFNPWE